MSMSERAASAAAPVTEDAGTGGLAALSLATSAGALIATSSCCVLPLVFGGLGAGAGAAVGLEVLAAYRMPLLVAGAFAIAAAWIVYLRQRKRTCTAAACTVARHSRATLAALVAAKIVLALAAGWVFVEPVLVAALRGA